MVIHLILADKQFHSLGAAVTKARSPAAIWHAANQVHVAMLFNQFADAGGSFVVNCQEC